MLQMIVTCCPDGEPNQQGIFSPENLLAISGRTIGEQAMLG